MTPPGIDPGTFRLVAQCLNHYANPGPNDNGIVVYFSGNIDAVTLGDCETLFFTVTEQRIMQIFEDKMLRTVPEYNSHQRGAERQVLWEEELEFF